jgi:hypothetical protein
MYPERAGLESPAMADDEGVLGNLPRSRPGKRSAKRDSGGRPSKTASKAAVKAEAAGKAAAKPARASKPARAKTAGAKASGAKSAAAKPRRAATPKPRPDPVRQHATDPAPQQTGDAVANAVHAAATVAATGVRVAGAVTREIRRRLPLP